PRPLAGRHLRGGHPHARARRPRVGRRADQPGAHGAQGRCFDALVSGTEPLREDRKSTRLNSSHSQISYAVFCLKKKKIKESKRLIEPEQFHDQHYDNQLLKPVLASLTHYYRRKLLDLHGALTLPVAYIASPITS